MTDSEARSLRGHYAGFGSRSVAFVTDLAILTVITVVSAWITVEVLQFFGIDVRDCASLAATAPYRLRVCHGALVLAPIVSTAFVIMYRVFFWATTGQTPGMAFMGVRVVRCNGRAMSFVTAARRMAGYLLSTFALGAGFVVILADDRRQGWHDKIAGTCVIYTWDAREYGRAGARVAARVDRDG